MNELAARKCKPCEGGVPPYNPTQMKEMLKQLKGWIVEEGKLVKLYKDNAATLTPDPLHSAFYDSHPPAATRIARLRTA